MTSRGPARRISRRAALRLVGAGSLGLAGAALLGCGDEGLDAAGAGPATSDVVGAPAPPPVPAEATPTPEPTPKPALPVGRTERALMAGTEWENPLVVSHSGAPGPRVLVLGGVHGNEPGGWLAAEGMTGWEPAAGSLLVAPRANRLSTFEFQRTLPDFGDLNRLYPGDPDHALPMARMAHAIVEVAREFEVDLVLDMHESWGFFLERAEDGSQDGTAFIGQTVTKGSGPMPLSTVALALVALNGRITEREQLTLRDRFTSRRERPELGRAPVFEELEEASTLRFGSSLSLGAYLPGLTPVLVEMGQRDQPEARRRELHQDFARELLGRVGVL